MRTIENKERKGKIHIVNHRMECGTTVTNCGKYHQKPHHNSSYGGNVCFGKWELTDKEPTCKTCLAAVGRNP